MGLMTRKKALLMVQDGFIPPGYQKYDYLETDTYKSYIDTGVAGNDNTIRMNFSYKSLARGNYSPILSNYDGTNTHTCWMLRNGANEKRLNFVLNNRPVASSSTQDIATDTVVGKRIWIEMRYAHITIICEGTEYNADTVLITSDISTENIFIGNYASIQSWGYSNRFYDFSIAKGGKLIRNYVPVVRKSDSKAGFYDTVNHTFNPSIGTEDFVAGND